MCSAYSRAFFSFSCISWLSPGFENKVSGLSPSTNLIQIAFMKNLIPSHKLSWRSYVCICSFQRLHTRSECCISKDCYSGTNGFVSQSQPELVGFWHPLKLLLSTLQTLPRSAPVAQFPSSFISETTQHSCSSATRDLSEWNKILPCTPPPVNL